MAEAYILRPGRAKALDPDRPQASSHLVQLMGASDAAGVLSRPDVDARVHGGAACALF